MCQHQILTYYYIIVKSTILYEHLFKCHHLSDTLVNYKILFILDKHFSSSPVMESFCIHNKDVEQTSHFEREKLKRKRSHHFQAFEIQLEKLDQFSKPENNVLQLCFHCQSVQWNLHSLSHSFSSSICFHGSSSISHQPIYYLKKFVTLTVFFHFILFLSFQSKLPFFYNIKYIVNFYFMSRVQKSRQISFLGNCHLSILASADMVEQAQK